jgi:hypothetical protein
MRLDTLVAMVSNVGINRVKPIDDFMKKANATSRMPALRTGANPVPELGALRPGGQHEPVSEMDPGKDAKRPTIRPPTVAEHYCPATQFAIYSAVICSTAARFVAFAFGAAFLVVFGAAASTPGAATIFGLFFVLAGRPIFFAVAAFTGAAIFAATLKAAFLTGLPAAFFAGESEPDPVPQRRHRPRGALALAL